MKKDEILKKIQEKDKQIEMFQKRMRTSDLCADLYDNAIVERAILKKELKECERTFLSKMVEKFVPKHKQEKLISDYFKN